MKVTTAPPEPNNPDIVVRMTWDESTALLEEFAHFLNLANGRLCELRDRMTMARSM